MFTKNALKKYIFLFATIIMLTACVPQATQAPVTTTSTPESNTASPAPKPTATAPGGFPTGIYKPDKLQDVISLQFSADGTFEFEFPTDRHLGRYEVNGDQIVLNQYDGLCVGLLGTYQWEKNGNTLTLKPINDTCTQSSRSEELGGRSWILQP